MEPPIRPETRPWALRWLSLPALALLAQVSAAQAETLQGRIVSVHDGDTLTLLAPGNVQDKIRLEDIDAPELGQPCGQASKQNLSRLAYGQQAAVDCPKVDKYRRKVCKATVAGQDVGLAQIEAGLAWWFRRYAREQAPRERDLYEAAETGAAADRAGLWQDRNPVPPWEWRKQRH